MKDKDYIVPYRILPVIVAAQLAGTSLWFAGNAVLPELQKDFKISEEEIGLITSAVQFGFITGTLFFAFYNVSDIIPSHKVYFFCSVAGAVANFAIVFLPENMTVLLLLRFLTGFFLAGIYPIGMKIAAGWFKNNLGNAIGFLVGALVLGTSFPFFLRSIFEGIPWKITLYLTSILAATGGFLILTIVKEGPYLKRGTSFNPKVMLLIFHHRDFRSAAFGYFGHMWELYAFWAFVPLVLSVYARSNNISLDINFWSFVIIAAGSLGCVIGGVVSKKAGSPKVAFAQLMLSGICCLISLCMFSMTPVFFLAFLIFWGIVVVGDSPQFSAITAQAAPREYIGTALTIVTCFGFFITIVSIQFISYFIRIAESNYWFLPLAVGPITGLILMRGLLRR